MKRRRHYMKPFPDYTGRRQASVEATQTCWYFDAHYNYHDTGFLDAPEYVPTGSVRAMDIDAITLGIAHDERCREDAAA